MKWIVGFIVVFGAAFLVWRFIVRDIVAYYNSKRKS